MKFSILFASLFAASSVSAATFVAFPTTLSCQTASGTSSWTQAELESIAAAGIKKAPIEKSAANASSGRCTKYKLPYYGSDLQKGAGTLFFVYNSKTQTIEYCGSNTISLDGSGYPSACSA